MSKIVDDHTIEILATAIAGSSVYNNELIGCISIYSVLKECKTLNPAKAMLIIPLMCHNGILSYINRTNTDIKSIEQLIIRKPELISNFSERFYSLLVNSINSVSILNSLELIEFSESNILKNDKRYLFSAEQESELGVRARKIITAAPTVSKLLEDDVENLFLQLRVKL